MEPDARVNFRLRSHRKRQADTLRQRGRLPYFRPTSSTDDTHVTIDGQEVAMFGGNDYLGLSRHPDVMQAAMDAIHRYGTSCTGSRFLNGTLEVHEALEDQMARLIGTEACVVFSGGYLATLGTVASLARMGNLIAYEQDSHASTQEACRLVRGETATFSRNSPESLSYAMQGLRFPERPAFAVMESVHSMFGDSGQIHDIIEYANTVGLPVVIDDAHGFGVIGQGRGIAGHVKDGAQIDVVVGTLSKSMASVGGFAAGSREVIDYIKLEASSFMFTAALSPADTAAALAALRILQAEPDRATNALRSARRLRDGLVNLGYRVPRIDGAVVPVVLGEPEDVLRAFDNLLQARFYANPVMHPAVPRHSGLLRLSVTAVMPDSLIDAAIDAFAAMKKDVLQ